MKTGLIVIFLVAVSILKGQNFHAYKYEDRDFFSFGVGFSGYYGDLQHQLIIPYPAITADLAHKLTPQIKLRESLSYFMIGASDQTQKQKDLIERNLEFYSHSLEFAISFEFQFIEVYSYKMRPFINPYLFAGVGGATVNPRVRIGDKGYNLRKLSTEDNSYSAISLSIPLGIGLKLAVSKYISFIGEFGYRVTNTDYLDDVSTEYADVSPKHKIRYQLADRSPELGLEKKKPGMTRGNPDNKDGYAILTLKLRYRLSDIF